MRIIKNLSIYVAIFCIYGNAMAQMASDIVAESFSVTYPSSSFFHSKDGAITRVYGQPFSTGESPIDSANRFVQQWSGIWGCDEGEFIPIGPWGGGHHLQPIMLQPSASPLRNNSVSKYSTTD